MKEPKAMKEPKPTTPPLRQRQQQRRRQSLIDAAREVFYETHYILATVEDIIQRAEISRPTFYRHFANKEALLREVMVEDVALQTALWSDLVRNGDPSREEIAAWAKRYLKGMRKKSRSVALFNIASGLDTSLIHEFSKSRDRVIRVLGEAIPAFRLAGDGSSADKARRAAVHLLFYQLEQVCFHCVFPGGDLDEQAMLDAFAANFRNFIDGKK